MSAARTLPELFLSAVREHGPRPLLKGQGVSLSYEQAAARAAAAAGVLRRLGLGDGDVVALDIEDLCEAAVAAWAVWLAGGVVAPLNPALGAAAKEMILRHVGAKAELNCLPRGGVAGKAAAPHPEAPALILYTSGTTAEPKGVVLSHEALAGSGQLMAGYFGWTPEDRYAVLGGVHTMSGLRNPCVAVPAAGASLVLPSKTDLFSAVAMIAESGATIVGTIPVFYREAARYHEKLPNGWSAGVRQFLCTGATLSAAQAAAFEERTGRAIQDYYGLTETCGLCAAVPPGETKRGTGDIGYAAGAEARVVGEDGAELPAGSRGELWIRSGHLMSGYHRRPEDTAERLKDGWLRTGDLARMDAGGRIVLLGRLDEVIKTPGTEMLVPAELDELLSSHPEVSEAGVCALVDPDGIERPAAFVVAREGPGSPELARDLKSLAAERIGRFAVPAAVRFVTELPRGVNGKLLRRELALWLEQGR